MELPKNVTQIGETNPHCKIYVEDYVISYIKQLNRHAGDKKLAVALYGVRKEESGVAYLFLYGACKLNFLQRECRHLSQAVQQEVEKQRKRYFSDYDFLGYRLLDGEMVEGFHICEQSVCRYIEGYAQFYEKNDSMLSFMLDERQGEAPPEEFDRAKYDVVKKRQEERRASTENKGGQVVRYRKREERRNTEGVPKAKLRNMQLTAAVSFVLLGAVGLAIMTNGEKAGEWQMAARQFLEGMTEKQLPDAVEVVNNSVQPGVIVAEDKLTDAILKENAAAASGESEEQQGGTQPSGTAPDAQTPAENQQTAVPETTPQPTATLEPTPTPTPEPDKPAEPEPAKAPVPEPTSYTVQKGDTLIGICIRTYGSDARVAEICSLNNINNPDDIKEGARILLP